MTPASVAASSENSARTTWTADSKRSNRSGIGTNGIPKGVCSGSNHPAPSPRMKRPFVAWSITVAALAMTLGCRNVADSTAWPTHLPGTWWISAAIAVSASQDGPARSRPMSVRWSFIQTDSKTSCSPMRAHVASRVAQSTACGEVLIPMERRRASVIGRRGWRSSAARS